MDNVTHALAGCLLAAGAVAHVERRIPSTRGFRRAAVVVGIIAAELPDSDLLYAGPVLGMGKLGYLLHHRGHTHTVLFAIGAALVVWAAALALQRGLRDAPQRGAMLGLALAGTLSHLLLDFTNSYGVHPFWPVDNHWYYGDAVFIVEPWLWVAALPPLLLLARSAVGRVLYTGALVAILAAAWRVDMVGRDVAVALTVGAVAWSAMVWTLGARRGLRAAVIAWLVVEGVFFGTAAAARRQVRMAVGPSLRDAVLTPEVSNPFCVRALVVELDGATYRATAATVAPFPDVRTAAACAASARAIGNATSIAPHANSAAVVWGQGFVAPHAELLSLAASNCEIAAALRFIRVPVWRTLPDASIEFSDQRYSDGGRGFASIVTPPKPSRCPDVVPGWIPPRSQELRTEN